MGGRFGGVNMGFLKKIKNLFIVRNLNRQEFWPLEPYVNIYILHK